MDEQYYFDQWPLESEIYNSQNFRIEKIVTHIKSKWWGSDNDWYGILTVPVLPEISYFYKKGHDLLWGKDKQSSKPESEMVAGIWPEEYFVHCINSYNNQHLYFLKDLKIEAIGIHLSMIRSKINKDVIAIRGYEGSDVDDPGYYMAYSPMLERQYFDSYDTNYKNRKDDKEFSKVVEYIYYTTDLLEHNTD